MSIWTRTWVMPALLAAVCAVSCGTALAQSDGGFVTKVRATATGEELSRQPGLWICEVAFKPMRYMRVEVTDPKTGKKTRELVWYVCYKAINRPLGQKKATDIDPVNDYDIPPSKPFFVPEFTLVTDDNGVQKTYHDIVLPEAQAAILKEREQRKAGGPRYRNSVEVVGPIPEVTDAETAPGQTIWGMAMFRGVDPDADHFRLFMTGFSNGYKLTTLPGSDEPLVLRRTVRQEYWRPGDGIDQNEFEFRLKGDPVWEYRPDDLKVTEGVEAIDNKPAAGKEKPAEEKPAEEKNDAANN